MYNKGYKKLWIMITKRHNLDIVINGESLEFESQDKINLRINNTVYNPEKVSVTQSEYSFSFNVPMSPKNNRIFGFANVPSVKGKFVKQFNAYVYADNVEIFKGLLRISSIGENNYKCNLISVKNSSIEDIFAESKMSAITWEVPYTGTATQNAVNHEVNPDYFYPLVAYGVFQKDAYLKIISGDNSLSYYTGTNILDKWTKYYAETFIPSPKLIELIKRMIEQKGYTYSGDVFNDDLINKLYLSSYITSEQDPAYNIGGSRGKINVNFNYTIDETISKVTVTDGRSTYTTITYGRGSNAYEYKALNYPEDFHYLSGDKKLDVYGDDTVQMAPLWTSKAEALSYDNNDMWEDGFIVIPHSGYYKVSMKLNVSTFSSVGNTVTDSYPEYVSNFREGTSKLTHVEYERQLNLDNIPIDIQLVKNDSNDLEFISTNKINYQRNALSSSTKEYKYSDYPNEAPYSAASRSSSRSGRVNTDGNDYYFQPYGKTRGYDRRVNEDFIIGMSTAVNNFGIAKRGRSWDNEYADYGYNSYNCSGYSKYHEESSSSQIITNTVYQDINVDGMNSCTYSKLSNKQHYGEGYMVVWLEKNDILTLKALFKEYKTYTDGNNDSYVRYDMPGYKVSGTVSVEAFSPNKKDLEKNWNSDSSFSKNLNLGNFLSEEETQKDFFENFLTTFNLSCNVENGNIEINKNVGVGDSSEAVSVDNRIDLDDMESEVIDFPTSIQIKWTTNEDESGFYHSVSNAHINDDDWKKWADIGSEKVQFIKNDFSTNDISKTSKFSYNWWMDFYLTDYYDGTTHIENANETLSLPIIARDEDFIDGGNYEEMMKKDGRSLKQRLWFKDKCTEYSVPNRNYSKFDSNGDLTECTEFLHICLPTRFYNGSDVLNYTRDKNSLLMRYFNVNENTDSNYATIEVYLTPQEYLQIKNGAMVRFDNDRYQICTITGYDPVGGNKTKLKLMKL